jgi:hypothetical protein
MIRRSLVIALLTIAPSAFAQASDADLADARKKFDTALEYEKQGDWVGALAMMREVAGVKSTSQVRFHIAVCLEHLNRLVEARNEYAGSKEDADIKEGASGGAMSKKAAERLADLDARIPKVELTVAEEVINAKATIDNGTPIPLLVKNTILLDPGEHKLTVYATSRKTFVKVLKVKEKDPIVKIAVELPLEDDEPPPPPKVVAPPPVAPPPRDAPPMNKWDAYPWIFGGVGLAALGVGGIMYAYRAGTIHEMDQACGAERDRCPRNVEDIEARGRTYTSVGNILLGVGAAAITTGVILYVVKPRSNKDSAITTVHVAGGPSTLGVNVVAAF